MRLDRVLLASSLAIAGAAACSRDFDSLFKEQPAEPATDTSDGRGDAGASEDFDPRADAAISANACTPLPGRCPASASCDGVGSGVCSTSCAGCCDCGLQTCPVGDGNRSCAARCESGATCNVGCALGGPCNLVCDGCTASKLRCEANSRGCNTTCSAGASCEETCLGSAQCEMMCAAGARCLLGCSATSTSCELSCPDGSRKDCGNGVFTCGDRACP